MLDRLEKSGLIERRPNPEDRRETLSYIVQSGAEKVAPLFESSRKAQDELVYNYTEKEMELLSDFFRKSVAMYEREREKLIP